VPQIKTLENVDWSFNPQIPKALILDLGTMRFIRGLLVAGARLAPARATSP